MNNYTYNYTLPSLVVQSAKKFPNKAAFRCMGKAITYAELEMQMNQLGHLLLSLDVKKGDRIGIFMARSLETAVAMYGIMSVGAIYVPINPTQPVARTHFLLKDCGIKHLVTNAGQKRALPSVVTNEINLKSVIGTNLKLDTFTIGWDSLNQYPKHSPNIPILETDSAYMLYTSGSTGIPKGIMHTHYSGLSYAKLSAEAYDLQPEDILGNHAPIYFDISTLGYFAAPLVGATTVIASEAHIKMPASLSQMIEKEKITIWYSVPLALIQMLQRGALEQRNMEHLRWVIFAGELFPTKHLRQLMLQWPNANYSNAYGPTETNVCTYYNIPDIPKTDAPISIGKAWGNTEIIILGKDEIPVEKGQVGELLVRSATLMTAYANRPDLNQKAFFIVKNEFGTTRKFYKTGDLVKEEADGNLTFLGRKDRQVKTRGFRVELDEITTFLLEHSAVEEAAVYPILDEDAQTIIEAAVILFANKHISEQDLILHLKSQLPSYALPHKINIKKQLPRTATGKIDLKILQTHS